MDRPQDHGRRRLDTVLSPEIVEAWAIGSSHAREAKAVHAGFLEAEQLKLPLAEATVQLRIWRTGAEHVDAAPSQTSVAGAARLTGPADLRAELDTMPVPNGLGVIVGRTPVPIAVVSDNGPCFRSETFAHAFTGPDPLLRHMRTRVRSPQTNGVIERFFGTLRYEHLYRTMIRDGDALSVEVNWFHQVYNTIRPHPALDDRTPHAAYLQAPDEQPAEAPAE